MLLMTRHAYFTKLIIPCFCHSRSEFSVEFKTFAEDGVIFYVNDKKHTDYIGLSIVHGYVVYGFNCGSGRAFITSHKKYNDGMWHKVSSF